MSPSEAGLLRRACAAALLLLPTGCAEPPQLGVADYGTPDPARRCEVGGRPGAAGIRNNLELSERVHYNLRTPQNYDPTIQHPLLVVHAPAGKSRYAVERLTGLTTQATGAGMLVAYVDSARLDLETIGQLGTVGGKIAEAWCVDPARIAVAGHSDGAMVAEAQGFLPDRPWRPAAIVASSAGIGGDDLKEYACPAPTPVLIAHSRRDESFPGFGQSAAAWWAACNRCAAEPAPADADGCRIYASCAPGGATVYCETDLRHRQWPQALNARLLDFVAGRS